MTIQNKKALIIANGSFPTHPFALELINTATYIICCDGGANSLIEYGGVPDAIIGDGDSITNINKAKYKDRLHIISEQETNDLTKAVNFAVKRGFNNLTILGATGHREDHTLGNISLLMDYQTSCRVNMVTDFGIFYPCQNHFIKELEVGSQLSIFNFGATNIQAIGLEYPVRDFSKWWEGTLNSVSSPNVEIKAKGIFLIYIPFQNKL